MTRFLRTVVGAVCLALGALGISVPVHAWRTAAELPEIGGAPFVGWQSDTVAVELYSGRVPVPPVELDSAIGHAIAEWTDVECSGLTLLYAGRTLTPPGAGDGHNTIAWLGTDWTRLGFPEGAAGVTDVEYLMEADGSWSIHEADVYLNTDFIWAGMSGGVDPLGRDVASVLTHEFGHLVGMLHPCEVASGPDACVPGGDYALATMYPEYTGPAQGTLDADDVQGFCSVYGASPTPCAAPCAAGAVCVDGACRPRCGTELCGSDQLCIMGACQLAALVCAVDGDCEVGSFCAAGICTRAAAGAPDGAACDVGIECASGLCSAAQYCSAPCDETCTCDASGQSCELPGAFAWPCTHGEDCIARVCLLDIGSSYCTASCASRGCPDGYACETVDGARVCRLPRPAASGCTVSSVPPPAGTSVVSFAIALFVGMFVHVRNRAKRS